MHTCVFTKACPHYTRVRHLNRTKRIPTRPTSSIYSVDKQNDTDTQTHEKKGTSTASKRNMLTFALPALGIFLANPLLSNIDNAFVGKTVGTAGLAALSPAIICTDQMLYLFSFLSRATTDIVSGAYSSDDNETENTAAVMEAASAPLTFTILSGICLSVFYMRS